MKQLPPICFIIGFLAVSADAGPVEAAIMAAMRLSEQPSYSWVATIADDARTYDIHGQTIRGSYSRVKMPVINSVRRRLGRSVTDPQIEMIFRGNVACVIQTERGWKRPDELRRSDFAEGEWSQLTAPSRHAAPLGGYPPMTPNRGSILRAPSSSRRSSGSERNYSNLQLAVSHPHEELGVIVGSHRDFTVEGEVASGTLTDLGAQLLLVRDGQETITPLRASGTFKLWLRNGAVIKYQVRLEGTIEVEMSSGRRQIHVQQITDTVLHDVGTTHFEVPAQAQEKLGA